MKVVFIGGGAHRYLSVARSIMADPAVMAGGEINVHDLNLERSRVMARMIEKSPEYWGSSCTIRHGTNLEEALSGADVVIVVLFAADRKKYEMSRMICGKHGFIGSDQLSPSGAILAMQGAPILLDIARKMETHCPQATLLNFANPAAVLAGAVNNHTSIRCLGVCAGFTNHIWDLNRVLGKDSDENRFTVSCAGVNHLSFICNQSLIGEQNLYDTLSAAVTDEWTMPELSAHWNESARKNIANSVHLLIELYRKYKLWVFSTEGDGLAHLDIEGHYLPSARGLSAWTEATIDKTVADMNAGRQELDRKFAAFLTCEDPAIWEARTPETAGLARADDNIMTRCIKALAGAGDMRIATSYLNQGAIPGFPDRTVMEYTQILGQDGIRPVENLYVPPVFHGLIAALASHQTLLGDAIATRDPRILFEALYSYPVKQDTAESKALWRDLLQHAAGDIPTEFQATRSVCL